MERRLPERFENRPQCLADHPVRHVGDAQLPLSATRLRNPDAADLAGPVAPAQQGGFEPRAKIAPLRLQLGDRLPVGSWGSPVARHLLQRIVQSCCNLLHRRGPAVICIGAHLRLPRIKRSGSVRALAAGGPVGAEPVGVFCCRGRQFELLDPFLNRGRLRLPWGMRLSQRLGGRYPAFPYYAAFRWWVIGRRSFRSDGLPPSGGSDIVEGSCRWESPPQ